MGAEQPGDRQGVEPADGPEDVAEHRASDLRAAVDRERARDLRGLAGPAVSSDTISTAATVLKATIRAAMMNGSTTAGSNSGAPHGSSDGPRCRR